MQGNEAGLQEMLDITERLLEMDVLNADQPILVAEQLRKVIGFHDRMYYQRSEPVIPDLQYDLLFQKLKVLESDDPSLVTPDSPTMRVSGGLNEDFPTVRHLVPMMSLENSYDDEDLREFDRKVRSALPSGDQVRYTVEPKYDGSSIAVIYENDRLVRAATRGNGEEGDDITLNARTIRSLPLHAPLAAYGLYRAELRGEVLIRLEEFRNLNEARKEENRRLRAVGKRELELFKHARNTAAGALRLKDPAEVAARKLEAVIYQLGYAEDHHGNELQKGLDSHYDNMQLLNQAGFLTPSAEKGRFGSIDEVIRFCREWEEKRDDYHYEIDGMVVKVDDKQQQRSIGATSHHPRWAIAYKFKAKQAVTRLTDVEFQVGRTGAVTPVAKLEPIVLTGVEISSVSLHNEDFIRDKDIRLGDRVVVERAGDVIPYIAGPVHASRTGKEMVVRFPSECPSCGQNLVKPADESIWRCINPDCPAQLEERLIHFVSKGAMNIEGLGRDIIRRFVSEGIICGLEDIYRMDYDRILELDGWQRRSVDKLRKSVDGSRNVENWRLLVGLGIRHVGATTAKMLAGKIGSIADLEHWTEEQLVELEDIGPKVAASIRQFFEDDHNRAILRTLDDLGLNMASEESQLTSNALEGRSFLFTGTLSRLSRDEAKVMVESHGGKNLSGVSSKLDFLVAGEKAGSKLAKAQKLGTVKVITEDDFLNMLT